MYIFSKCIRLPEPNKCNLRYVFCRYIQSKASVRKTACKTSSESDICVKYPYEIYTM